MKYAVVIIDGAADEPIEALAGKTPLQAARLPAMDRLASEGILGQVRTCPAALPCGSDVAIMSVFGYDPAVYYTGRAPLEAAAQSIPLSGTDWIFRANTVTITDGVMKDNTADNISQEHAEAIIALLNKELSGPDLRFHSGVGYRNLLIVRREIDVATTPPHDILDQPVAGHLPRGASAPFLIDLAENCKRVLAASPVCAAANEIWFWGQGKKPRLSSFKERFGLSAAVITAVDLVRGLALLAGWDIITVPGATAYFDTNYAGKGEYAVRSLEDHDLVCVHIEAPDEAGHKGDPQEKIKALENIDRLIVAPLYDALRKQAGGWRLLLLPDHPTPCACRTHTHAPVPFALAGSGVPRQSGSVFNESTARETGVLVEPGHLLMDHFVRGNWKAL
jgi:2,3-bisphosphoglycerate-independent phosphoglycerate mutase